MLSTIRGAAPKARCGAPSAEAGRTTCAVTHALGFISSVTGTENSAVFPAVTRHSRHCGEAVETKTKAEPAKGDFIFTFAVSPALYIFLSVVTVTASGRFVPPPSPAP